MTSSRKNTTPATTHATERSFTVIPPHIVPESEPAHGDKPAVIKLLLTPQDAAFALSIDRSTLYKMLMSGEIASITIGRARRISVKALEAWIDEQVQLVA